MPAKNFVKRIFNKIIYFGLKYKCNFCGAKLKNFIGYGFPTPITNELKIIGAGFRSTCLCPVCGSSDRERHLKLFFDLNGSYLKGGITILHIAPESNLSRFLSTRVSVIKGDKYEKGYSYNKDVNNMDITSLNFPDNSFDAILCNHVLEHITTDIDAMKEIYRVLKKGGWGILQVPISYELTNSLEDDSILSEEAREKAFGQKDHVRIYGPDYFERLKNAGFTVKKIKLYTNYMMYFKKYGLIEDEEIFLVSKNF